MSAKNKELAEEDVLNMTCDKLRKELKKKRASTAGKKSELQSRLLEFLAGQNNAGNGEAIREEPEAEAMDTDEAPANRTFTVEEEEETENTTGRFVHENTPTNAVAVVLDDDLRNRLCGSLGIDLQSFEVKSRPRVHRLSTRLSLRASSSTPQTSERPGMPIENRGITPVRQRAPSSGRDRFAMIHAREMEKEETLGERQERLKKRHEFMTGDVPEAIRRLATPKSVPRRDPVDRSTTRSAARNWQVQDPEKMSFQFGDKSADDFPALVSSRAGCSSSSAATTSTKKTKSVARSHVDVKKLTKSQIPKPCRLTSRKIIPATVPEDDTFTEYISTPKGTTPTRVPRRAGYTPHSTRKVFVDTTQLTDREFTLALEEGLIPGRAATNLEKQQVENKKRRDDIIALKRKMNIK
ncbi:SAP domain-containing protein [Caenorhabditis elegans]|uniref:SAP domain-containing protein n=1 Tax=Caenorhabditis elegans TaxID=6239 RepID=Q18546_CAEEL|nr:SAP domain-containing protein [Caenorhabditis elegans]CAA94338.2 SAP domain-containing protein [Caenorhabditis elegans]|eukprot:NP_502516.2 Uncharacterized protein CELE_C39E9.12 [Caenorhabditis elegans]